MANYSASLARKTRALALAAASMAAVTSPALADGFTQKECKGIAGIAGAVVRRVGADMLSVEFRQSFMDWVGPEARCNGPKEIAIVTDQDSATFGTIRSELLQLPKPISLQKAGLRGVEKSSAVTTTPVPQKRSDAAPAAPTIN